MKAYLVHDGEDQGVVEFALHAATARRNGANEMNCEFADVESCRRAPQFDCYAPGPVPPQALISAGWWFECSGCGIRCDAEAEDEDGEPLDLYYSGQSVYCSQSCRSVELAQRRANAAAKAAMVELVQTRWPLAQIHSVHVFGDRLTARKPGGASVSRAIFSLPALKEAITWHFGEDFVSVSQSDEAAYRANYKQRADAPTPPTPNPTTRPASGAA